MGRIKTIISTIAGGILFAGIFDDVRGLFVGMVLGFLLARNFIQKGALGRLEKRLKELETLLRYLEKTLKQPVAAAESPAREEKEQSPIRQPAEATPLEKTSVPAKTRPVKAEETPGGQSRAEMPGAIPDKSVNPPTFVSLSTPPIAPIADTFERMLASLWSFFTQGNVVLRVGLLVLFFGVAFLLKYAAEREMLPIELRLLGVALTGIAMLLFGWKLRLRRAGFALLMQGGGIGLLFLDVFAAFKLYALLPEGLAFAIMVGLVCTSAALALLQDAKPLALFGAIGGFLAPVLLSTDSGNHVALFSYYALLNAGILIIAWFKAWRVLNLLGFFFTLGIGSAWGVRSYEPRYFASTEPFLVLFFLMFTLIGVLFAFRQPPKLRGYVDGTLVFGTPIICFSLQTALVKDIKYGLAISALLISLFYVGLARFLWNMGNERLCQGMRTLTEAFLALGTVFVTLAVPLALSGRWTAVTWALEGAALIWLGVRQNRILPRNFGALLQLVAAFFFLAGTHPADERIILFNGVYLGCLIISLSALFSSWYLYRAENLSEFEGFHHLLLFVWGIIWWFGGGINELNYQLLPYYIYQNYAVLLFVGLSCAAMITLARRISWPIAAWPSLGLLPVMLLVSTEGIDWYSLFYGIISGRHFFSHLGWLAWPLSFFLLYYCLYKGREWLYQGFLSCIHVGSYLLLTLLMSAETVWHVYDFVSRMGTAGRTSCWPFLLWGLIPMGILRLVQCCQPSRRWPFSEYGAQYDEQGSGCLLFFSWLWLLTGSLLVSGNAPPLPFIPLVNPLELSQLIVLILMAGWLLHHQKFLTERIPSSLFIALGGGTLFIWLNTLLARSVHHLAGVRFDLAPMLDSQLYQAALAILWGVLSLILMVTAHRLKHRALWLVGAGLVAITVAKLFLVDLANSGTVERIVSFLAVGVLLMIIGYFAPLPPARIEQEEAL